MTSTDDPDFDYTVVLPPGKTPPVGNRRALSIYVAGSKTVYQGHLVESSPRKLVHDMKILGLSVCHAASLIPIGNAFVLRTEFLSAVESPNTRLRISGELKPVDGGFEGEVTVTVGESRFIQSWDVVFEDCG